MKQVINQWIFIATCVLAGFIGFWALLNPYRISVFGFHSVPIKELSMHQELWANRNILVQGVLRQFSDSESASYFEVESGDGYRVGIKGPSPDVMASLIGSSVTVRGDFTFLNGFGIVVQDAAVKPISTQIK